MFKLIIFRQFKKRKQQTESRSKKHQKLITKKFKFLLNGRISTTIGANFQ